MSVNEQLAGLTVNQQRRRLAAMARSSKGSTPVAVKPLVAEFAAAVLALRNPCHCRKCQKRKRYPVYYFVGVKSYECVLEENAPRDKRHYDGNADGYVSMTDSPFAHAMQHIRQHRLRINERIALEPESEAALKREIARAMRGQA